MNQLNSIGLDVEKSKTLVPVSYTHLDVYKRPLVDECAHFAAARKRSASEIFTFRRRKFPSYLNKFFETGSLIGFLA